ncbi:hypothetical protein PSN45_002718 [Yamadazyma tenuis]|uniref:EXPERA domain-containing protein n=1 Tax=Candida tenuis (strain ATCC 10573 / BCRC 21748 / CBS 615 / JCM 9827 / NBRC 10315 / NRRL Y-1498 / VKM Y-70) TaxID=590646 RepID=G3AX19_CANTC|nr:uncharacterized protein CANTEDRAFT_117826 [Yamadazyma tenuis ATCC 10573]EGV66666.1 hypothetical protein CANTEDRAFT_117826 [Yamadazyma tenuis ATCC 10573]WEJ95205.1 hypothetical protein PSN45_002718 [Yamadazyma tenuis]
MALFDRFCFYYYLIHIPVTVLIDSSVVVTPVFRFQEWIIDFHVATNKDILMTSKPLWFKGFVWIELLFQLPWFVYAMVAQHSVTWHLLNVVYGVNASLTTFACILYVIGEGPLHGLSDTETWKLVGVYVPYVVLPLVILAGSFRRIRASTKV